MRVLVIVAGGLPAGYVGCYGNEWLPTPAFDRLAAEGIVFDQHYADQPDAAGADRAWRTGCYALPLADGQAGCQAPDLFSALSERGIATRLITDRRLGSDEQAGWQRVHSVVQPIDAADPLAGLLSALEQTLDELAAREQWLCKVDTSILRHPDRMPESLYRGPVNQETEVATPDEETAAADADAVSIEESEEEEAVLAVQEAFGAAVVYLDSWMSTLYDRLSSRDLLDQIVILLTSDSGQRIGPPGDADVSDLLHEERLHLPLLLRLPGRAEAGRRITALTQSIDLLPTLFEALGHPAPAVHGYSLWPLVHGKSQRVRPYACAGVCAERSVAWWLRTPEWSFHHALQVGAASGAAPVRVGSPDLRAGGQPTLQLYVRPDDRWEVNDIRQHYLEWAENLEKVLTQFLERARHPGILVPPELEAPGQRSVATPVSEAEQEKQGVEP
jgi:arylsulfatase A-like enzyme